jgi:hypothetical protein
MLKGLLGALGGMLLPQGGAKFKDNKGTFQGGAEGVIGGRMKDAAMGLVGKDMFERARGLASKLDTTDNNQVMRLQNLMNTVGIGDSEGQSLTVDGMLGPKTLSALRSLQRGDTEESLDYTTDYSGETAEVAPQSGPANIPEANLGEIGQSYEVGSEPDMAGPWAPAEEIGSNPASWVQRLFGTSDAINETRGVRNELFTRLLPSKKAIEEGGPGLRWQRKDTSGGY